MKKSRLQNSRFYFYVKINIQRELQGGPMVRTRHSHRHDPCSVPGQGTNTHKLHMVQSRRKNFKTNKKDIYKEKDSLDIHLLSGIMKDI